MTTQKRTRRTALILLVSAALALSMTSTGTAHGGNHGTIKVHDDMDADPDQRNEPQVDCDFWIEGFNMDGSGGELVFYSWPPDGDKTEVMRADWTGTAEADEDGFHFLEGPFELETGHYRVEAFSDEGHPGDHGHFAKAKMFKVTCEDDLPPDDEPEPSVTDECPPGSLSATAHEDSSISVSAVDLDQDATLMRSDGGEFVEVATLSAESDTFVDTDTEIGVTYTYQLVIDGEVCDLIEVTAIPVFPGLIGAALATGLGLLGYIGLRRRS